MDIAKIVVSKENMKCLAASSSIGEMLEEDADVKLVVPPSKTPLDGSFLVRGSRTYTFFLQLPGIRVPMRDAKYIVDIGVNFAAAKYDIWLDENCPNIGETIIKRTESLSRHLREQQSSLKGANALEQEILGHLPLQQQSLDQLTWQFKQEVHLVLGINLSGSVILIA